MISGPHEVDFDIELKARGDEQRRGHSGSKVHAPVYTGLPPRTRLRICSSSTAPRMTDAAGHNVTRVLPRAHRQIASMPKMAVETGLSGHARTMRIAIACLVLMACSGAKPASSNNGSQTSGSPAASGSSSSSAPTCRAINEHARTLVESLHPREAEDVVAANPRRLDGFPSPEMIAAFERATGECRDMNPAEAQVCMSNKITDILAADCEKRAPSAAQRRCWINATTYAAFVACDSAP